MLNLFRGIGAEAGIARPFKVRSNCTGVLIFCLEDGRNRRHHENDSLTKMKNLEQMTTELLALPVPERARLAKLLADSVDDFLDGRIEKSWDVEVASRVEETEAGTTELLDSKDVLSEARSRLEKVRKISSSR